MMCAYCNIITGISPADIVCETDKVLVFRPLETVAPNHLLVVPRRHASSLYDIDESSLGAVMAVVKKTAELLKNDFGAEGVNVLHASGLVAQQSVDHFHFHVIPRYENDGLDLWIRNNL